MGLQTLPTPRRTQESASAQAARPGPGEGFAAEPSRPAPTTQTPVQGTYCRHKIFGRGKVVQRVEPNKYKINFPGFGLKLIIEDFVELE